MSEPPLRIAQRPENEGHGENGGREHEGSGFRGPVGDVFHVFPLAILVDGLPGGVWKLSRESTRGSKWVAARYAKNSVLLRYVSTTKQRCAMSAVA